MKYPEIKLGEVADIKGGKRLPKGDLLVDFDTGFPYIRAQDIKNGLITFKEPKFITSDLRQKLKNYTVNKHDVCITIVGAYVGDVGIVPNHLSGANLTENAVKLTNLKNNFNSQYLKYALLSREAQEAMKKFGSGAAQDKLGIYKIKEIQIPNPPPEIQRKIAGILSAYDRLIENNTRRIEILEEMARSIYREWFVKFRFPGHEQVQMVDSELGLIPEGWEITSLGNHINTQKGYAFKSSWYQEQGIKIVKVSDFTDYSIDISKLVSISEEIAGQYKKHELKANDIIIQTVGSWASNPQSVVGKVIRVPNIAAKTLLNQNAVKVITKESINQIFLFYSIKNERFKSYIIGCAQGAASQASITLDAIREFKILLPPSSLLDFLADFVSPMWKLINNLEDKNLNLRCTRDYLLPRLISGEIDVENLDINTGEIAA